MQQGIRMGPKAKVTQFYHYHAIRLYLFWDVDQWLFQEVVVDIWWPTTNSSRNAKKPLHIVLEKARSSSNGWDFAFSGHRKRGGVRIIGGKRGNLSKHWGKTWAKLKPPELVGHFGKDFPRSLSKPSDFGVRLGEGENVNGELRDCNICCKQNASECEHKSLDLDHKRFMCSSIENSGLHQFWRKKQGLSIANITL